MSSFNIFCRQKLKSVEDAVADNADFTHEFKNKLSLSEEFIYDANGNVAKDFNKAIIGIQYNFLNLPQEIDFC